MKKYYLFILLTLLLLPNTFAAIDYSNSMRAYYSFENSITTDDNGGTYNLTNVNAVYNTTGKVGGSAAKFDGTNDMYLHNNNVAGSWVNSGGTMSAWLKQDTHANWYGIVQLGDSSDGSEDVIRITTGDSNYMEGGSYARAVCAAASQCDRVISSTPDMSPPDTDWHHGVVTWNSSIHITGFWLDGVDYGDNVTEAMTFPGTAWFFYIGASDWSGADPIVAEFDGALDDVGVWTRELTDEEIEGLYFNSTGCDAVQNPTGCAAAPASGNQSERLQQDADVVQTTPVTINSVTYVPVMSSAVTVPSGSVVYAQASVPIDPTASNTATCRITQDGSELNASEQSRSLTAGSAGNLILSSFSETLSGSIDFGIECYRTGGGSYDVDNATLLINILKSPGGTNLTYEDYNVSGSVSGVITSQTFTTSTNYTEAGLSRALVLDLTAALTYSATGNITLTPELAGSNCTAITRYGASGSTGSITTTCYTGSLLNDTAYTFELHGTGSGTIDAKAHVKEFIIHPEEINSTSLNGITINGTDQTLASTNITVQAGHTTPDVVVSAGVNVVSTSATQTAVFYLTNGSADSSTVSRGTDEGEPGVVGLTDIYKAAGTETLSLIGTCTSCSLLGGDLTTYLSSDLAATPNEFTIYANSTYGGSLSEYSVTLSDGRSFTTTTGSIDIPATGQLLNISLSENGGAAIPYYANSSAATNHNSTNDVTVFVTPYTIINATYGGVKVNNFTVNGTTTTSGAVYVRIFNSTEEVNISAATADDGTNLSDQSANVTASPYLENYTFVMLTANAFNFSLYDEITEALITESMTVELITGATAGTYNTSNGTLYLELLTPSDYTIRYYSTEGGNYTQRDYIQTLTDRQRYDISLYGILNAESTDMVVTIKDTSGDPVEDAIVKLLRYYVSCACYNVVEMATTSAAGESYFVVDAYDGHYKFAVEYAGATEFLSSSPENFIPSGGLVSRTITINLGSAYFESFRALTDVARTLTYNNDTKGLSFTWNDPSGIVTRGCLYAEYLDGVHYTAVTPVCQNATTGSVVMTLNNTVASYKYYAELETSTTYSDYVVFSGVVDKIRETLLQGNTGLGAFLGAGVMAVLALMFSFSAIAVMIITAVGVIAMSFLGLASLTTVFITGLATLVIGIAAYLMRS